MAGRCQLRADSMVESWLEGGTGDIGKGRRTRRKVEYKLRHQSAVTILAAGGLWQRITRENLGFIRRADELDSGQV